MRNQWVVVGILAGTLFAGDALAQLRRRVDVDLAAHLDDGPAILLTSLERQVHGYSSALSRNNGRTTTLDPYRLHSTMSCTLAECPDPS